MLKGYFHVARKWVSKTFSTMNANNNPNSDKITKFTVKSVHFLHVVTSSRWRLSIFCMSSRWKLSHLWNLDSKKATKDITPANIIILQGIIVNFDMQKMESLRRENNKELLQNLQKMDILHREDMQKFLKLSKI